MEKTEVIVSDDWKFVHVDAMNWQVFQRREIGAPRGKSKDGASRVGEMDWVALPAFFGNAEGAAEYVYKHMGDNAGKKTLREFINYMKASRDEVIEAVRSHA